MNDIFNCISVRPTTESLENIYIVIDVNSNKHRASYSNAFGWILADGEKVNLNSWCYADQYYQTRLKLILQEIEKVKDSLLGSDCDGQLRYDINFLENIIEVYSVTARL